MHVLPVQLASSRGQKGGFSLIEIVVALTITAVVAAVAIPSLKGLQQDEQSQVPVRELAELVQEVRSRAVREGRPYQIVFERGGVHAMEGSRPFSKREELMEHLEELRRPPVITETHRELPERPEVSREAPRQEAFAGGAASSRPQALPTGSPPPAEVPAGPVLPWVESITLAGKSACSVLLWGDASWDTMEGDKLRAWVFQPTGMLSPARVRLQQEGNEMEASFDPMTGELVAGRSGPASPAASL